MSGALCIQANVVVGFICSTDGVWFIALLSWSLTPSIGHSLEMLSKPQFMLVRVVVILEPILGL